MSVREAYNTWSEQYDTNVNRTRDLEAIALKKMLGGVHVKSVLEIGCGTGKNTAYLLTKADKIVAADLSEAMLAKAGVKITSTAVQFVQANILEDWTFTDQQFDLVTFSLVLEHIANLYFVFEQAARKLKPGGKIYVGELHPFKQYTGTKARFDTEGGRTEVECYNHHVSDFVLAAQKQGLQIMDLQEFFDEGDRNGVPRILSIVFSKMI